MKIIILILTLISISVSSNFTEPKCLNSSIDFWEKIYTIYGKSDGIFHNKNTMEIYIVKKLPIDNKLKNLIINNTLDSLRIIYPTEEIRLQSGVKEQFTIGYKNYMKYSPMILKELEKNNMPLELSLLPFVESSYNPSARSKVNAIGMWQILNSTAKLYGNKHHKNLYNPEISTKIALRLLQDNYEKTDSWELALIAYNSGADGMQIAIKQLNTQDVCIIIDQYKGPRFKFASKNFISQFLAVKRIMDCRD